MQTHTSIDACEHYTNTVRDTYIQVHRHIHVSLTLSPTLWFLLHFTHQSQHRQDQANIHFSWPYLPQLPFQNCKPHCWLLHIFVVAEGLFALWVRLCTCQTALQILSGFSDLTTDVCHTLPCVPTATEPKPLFLHKGLLDLVS